MSVELKGQDNSFLKCAFKCGLYSKLRTIEAIADDADMDLFCCKMAHFVHSDIPPVKSCNDYLRPKGHELPRCDSEMHRKSFLPRCLFKYMQCFYVRFHRLAWNADAV